MRKLLVLLSLVALFQRGWRGYADHDVWGFDTYLAGVMAAGMRQLAVKKPSR